MKNKKICVVGAGMWGLNHIKTLNVLGSLGGVVEISQNRIEKIKYNFPNCSIFANLNEAISAKFDGFVIATPPSTHYDLAIEIIKNKKPLLVEKPLTLDSESAKKLCDYAQKMNVKLMVGHVLLFHPAFKKMKQLIKDGKIGEIQYIYSNRLNLGTFRTNENVFWSFAPHDISLFNFFFDQKPLSITSRGIDILQKNIHDSSITSFKYKNNKMGHIFVSWLHPFKEHRFVIIGSKGMLHFEDSLKDKPILFYDKRAEFVDSIPNPRSGGIEKIVYNNKEMALSNELEYFISKIDNGKIEIADGKDGLEVIRVMEKATKSLSNK